MSRDSYHNEGGHEHRTNQHGGGSPSSGFPVKQSGESPNNEGNRKGASKDSYLDAGGGVGYWWCHQGTPLRYQDRGTCYGYPNPVSSQQGGMKCPASEFLDLTQPRMEILG